MVRRRWHTRGSKWTPAKPSKEVARGLLHSFSVVEWKQRHHDSQQQSTRGGAAATDHKSSLSTAQVIVNNIQSEMVYHGATENTEENLTG
jgi:hypothetical protein